MPEEVIPNKFRGKGKTGLFCPFRVGNFCNSKCGLYCEGLGSCVFHAINQNIRLMQESFDKLKK